MRGPLRGQRRPKEPNVPHLSLGQPTKDEFLAWKDHPVSRWAFRALKAASEAQRAAWMADSWDKGQADPVALAVLRTRSDAYAALEEPEYEDWCALNGDDPQAGDDR